MYGTKVNRVLHALKQSRSVSSYNTFYSFVMFLTLNQQSPILVVNQARNFVTLRLNLLSWAY